MDIFPAVESSHPLLLMVSSPLYLPDDDDDDDDDFDDFDDDDDAVDDDDAWLGSLYPMTVPYCPVTSGTSSSGRFLFK